MADPLRQPLTDVERRALSLELDRLLGAQLQRVRRRFAVHGLALLLLLPLSFVVLAFGLDHVLRLPLPIRLFHTLVVLTLTGFAAVRYLRYPLSRAFAPVDVATLVERAFPELHQRLVSAIQLKQAIDGGDAQALRNQSPAMIERLLAETADAARALPFERLLDPTRTRRAWLGASALLLALGVGAVARPATAWIFVQRHLGRDLPYPRATTLIVELPPAGPELQRIDRDGRTELLLAAGADLHVSVLAQGVVPPEAFLEVTTGDDRRSLAMQTRPGGRFRHVFRRLSTGFSFHARGGDDETGDREVVVQTMHPPQVEGIKAELTPPAYTRAAPVVQTGGAIEALAGTSVTLSVTTTEAATAAVAAFLESGKRLPLARTTRIDDGGTREAWTGGFVVEGADRYQIELVSQNGLRNPNPGTYPVSALLDYAPVGRWLLPEDESGTLLLPEGLLCLRGDAHDDFGLAAAALRIDAGKDHVRELALVPTAAGAAPQATKAIAFVELLELKPLLGEQRATEGIALQLTLTDNREPKANTTELPRRTVQIVDGPQLFASIARNFRSLREDVEQALELQLERQQRLTDLAAEQPQPGLTTGQVLTTVEVGQGRVQSVAERLLQGSMRAFDTHLWNRLDPSPAAAEVVQFYVEWHRAQKEPQSHQAAFYRELLQRRRAGTLAAMPTALDPILAMTGSCDRLQRELAPAAVRALAQAQIARTQGELAQALNQASQAQARIVEVLKELLARLDEWNDYQDLVQEARALRERQRDVKSRTEDIRGKK